MSKKRKSFLKSLDPYDWFFILVAFISIGYGLYRAYDMGPDWWGNVAGPLFSLASGFLFVVALRMQLREHRHALEEMEQNNANHAALLLVAKQEKEFNVLLKAYEDVKRHIESIRLAPYTGLEALARITAKWLHQFSQKNFEESSDFRRLFRTGSCEIYKVLPDHLSIEALIAKSWWIYYSVCPCEPGGPSTKELDPRDRALIFTLITPVISDISRATGENVIKLINRLKEIEAYPTERLEELRVNTGSILICRKIVERIEEARSRKDYDDAPSP